MPNHPSGLTSIQRRNIEEFRHLFAEVEKALKARLGRRVNDPTAVSRLIEEYAGKNPHWAESSNRLRNLTDIRNLLTHQCGTSFHYPIAIAPSSLHAIREIKENLLKPEPVSVRFRKGVTTVSPDDSLASVLALVFENGFSQFPVATQGKFGGLITENEIVRWLGHRTRRHSLEVNLGEVSVRIVLQEKDPFLRGMQIFHFEKLETPVEEVMGRFHAEPGLEVILLTISGGKDTPLEGIITQWDAARYAG